eukprot:m.19859 g.19859  ORF g.19859 m.19859 type:complete len:69 (-) comp8090_c0_seq1:1151-1357(-)
MLLILLLECSHVIIDLFCFLCSLQAAWIAQETTTRAQDIEKKLTLSFGVLRAAAHHTVYVSVAHNTDL